MSGFQRFVTYINLYEENNKIRSVGFARVERQGGQCRMEIHMRGTGYSGISCPVYLFVRKEEQMAGIFIGKLQMNNGTGDGRFLLESGDLCGSGHDVDEVGGFLMFVNEKVMFASQWDEKEILREQFVTVEALKEAEAFREQEKEEARQAEERKREEEQKKEEERKKEQEARGRQSSRQFGAGRWQQARPQPEIRLWQPPRLEKPLEKPEQDVKTKPEIISEQENQAVIEAPPPIDAAAPSVSCEEVLHAAEAAVSLQPDVAQNPKTNGDASFIQNPEPNSDSNIKREDAPDLEPEHWATKWQFILENYPVLTPFEGEEDILCVRMELKDLHLLPKRHWYLGNNSFLLHGFFNYRYLILGAMEQDGRKHWFVGIPGVFQSQEKVMAAIFGFTEYKSEKTAEQKTNQFGYWYRFLE